MANNPINSIDITGLTFYQSAVANRIDEVKQILAMYNGSTSPANGQVIAWTACLPIMVPWTHYNGIFYTLHPYVQSCVIEHEMRHQQQVRDQCCYKYSQNRTNNEIEAYNTELNCLYRYLHKP